MRSLSYANATENRKDVLNARIERIPQVIVSGNELAISLFDYYHY